MNTIKNSLISLFNNCFFDERIYYAVGFWSSLKTHFVALDLLAM